MRRILQPLASGGSCSAQWSDVSRIQKRPASTSRLLADAASAASGAATPAARSSGGSSGHCRPLQLRQCQRRLLHTHRSLQMPQRSLPAWFVRGGTSNGLVIKREDLPDDESQWQPILSSAMGSPDTYGRQLDGMGSGISSTSKVVVLGPPSRPDVDVDYTFVQVGIRDGKLDVAGNCGNMSSAVGPIAWDLGIITEEQKRLAVETDEETGHVHAVVRFLNTNTGKVLVSRFKLCGEASAYAYDPHGTYAMDGVPGTQSKITITFTDPAGAKTGKALPTGNPMDELRLADGTVVLASLVDVSNPGVFIHVDSLGLGQQVGTGSGAAPVPLITPATIEADAQLKSRLEEIRRAGAVRMGLDPAVESVPKIVILFSSPSASSNASSVAKESSPSVDIQCQAMSMGQAHKAVPLTLALCLGAATRLDGTIPSELCLSKAPRPEADGSGDGKKSGGNSEPEQHTVTIGHPSGTLDVGTTMLDGRIASAQLLRTARVLMKGEVLYESGTG